MLKGKNIFIVEDNAMNRVIYNIILTKAGCQKIEFDRWGRNTLKKLKQDQYDLIILDLMLPQGNSGYTIFEEIRQIPEYASIPIVAVSASEPAISIPRVQNLGFNGFIAKPLDKELFPEQLSQLLEGKNIWYAGDRL